MPSAPLAAEHTSHLSTKKRRIVLGKGQPFHHDSGNGMAGTRGRRGNRKTIKIEEVRVRRVFQCSMVKENTTEIHESIASAREKKKTQVGIEKNQGKRQHSRSGAREILGHMTFFFNPAKLLNDLEPHESETYNQKHSPRTSLTVLRLT